MVVLGVSALAVAGCSSTGGGHPVAASSSVRTTVPTGMQGTATVSASENPLTDQQLWDPCTIDPSVNTAMDLDPNDFSRNNVGGLSACGWSTPVDQLNPGVRAFSGQIYVSRFSYDEAMKNSMFVNLRPTTVGGRPATMTEKSGNRPDTDCMIVWGTSFGSMMVEIGNSSKAYPADACGLAV